MRSNLFDWLDAVALTINLQQSFVYDRSFPFNVHDSSTVIWCMSSTPAISTLLHLFSTNVQLDTGKHFMTLLQSPVPLRAKEVFYGASVVILIFPLDHAFEWTAQ